MKYLLHHSDSVYDDTTKRWLFTLDKRIGNPINIKISKLSFTAAVAASYPPVVYMRSNALHNMARVKHSVELKSVDHENSSNVIAVLQETHTQGRYKLHEPVFLPVNPHTYHSRALDIYFTDGSTVLDGGVSTGEPESTNVTDQDVLDITDLIFFLDSPSTPTRFPKPRTSRPSRAVCRPTTMFSPPRGTGSCTPPSGKQTVCSRPSQTSTRWIPPRRGMSMRGPRRA